MIRIINAFEVVEIENYHKKNGGVCSYYELHCNFGGNFVGVVVDVAVRFFGLLLFAEEIYERSLHGRMNIEVRLFCFTYKLAL